MKTIELLNQGKIKVEKTLLDMTLEELEAKATQLRQVRDKATVELRTVVKAIDDKRATESVKEIVSGLSDEQKKAMYAQLVGVNSATSKADGKEGKR